MLPDRGTTLARRIADELLTQGDLSIADVVFAPNLLHHGLAPLGAGVAGAKECTRILRQAFRDLSASVEDEIAEEDRVVLRLALSGTHRTTDGGSVPTGTRARSQWVLILRLNSDGKVMESWSSPDFGCLLQQLGAQPVAAPAPNNDTGERRSR